MSTYSPLYFNTLITFILRLIFIVVICWDYE